MDSGAYTWSQERKAVQEEMEKMEAKHRQHEKINHPMTKDQLEEVWEEQDHMAKEDWDPKTFFAMHDLDGNGQWDDNEVRILFKKELDKAYDPNAPEDDTFLRCCQQIFRWLKYLIISFLVILSELLRPEHDCHLLQQQSPWLGPQSGDRDGELDVPHNPALDLDGGLHEAQGVLPQRHILQLDLAGQQRDGELVRVEVLQVLAQVVVEEPGRESLQHVGRVTVTVICL